MKHSRNSSLFIHYSNNNGQSLVEILVALAVGTILIVAATSVIAPALRTNTQADKVQVSSALGKELLENVRVFSEADWHNISNLATSSANKYFLVSAQSPFVVATGTEGISAGGIASGTIGYWKLDEATGTTAYDFSGNNSTGTLTNGPLQISGRVGGGLGFDGTNDYVKITKSSTSTETIGAWIKLNAYPSAGKVFGIVAHSQGNDAAGNFDKIIYVDENGRIGWYVWDTAARKVLGTTQLQLNTWYYVAGVIGSSGQGVFVDGIQENIDQAVTASWTGGTEIDISFNAVGGGESYLPADHYNGSIDEVRVYNRALSAAEIKNIYQAGIYTRYFYLDNVGRDASGNILSSGGTNDPSTEKLNVVYGWPNGPTSTFSMHLTRFRNNVFRQTNWFGGPGQDGPSTSTNDRFSTSTQIDYSSTTGSIYIDF